MELSAPFEQVSPLPVRQAETAPMVPSSLLRVFFTAACWTFALGAPQGQAPRPSMEQRLKGEYALTRVTNKGVVIGLGDILVVKQAGIVGMPASCHGYFANSFTKGARIQPGGARLLEVGDKVYLTNIEVKDTQVVFSVQSCRACDPSSNDRSDSPLRASLAFQFPKEYLATADFKDIQGAIGEVFAVDKPAFERLSKQTGDRNYVDIRLGWTKKPVRFGDITLKLVAIDIKKNTYTVDLIVDDKLIQKKDKRVNEAVEFYAVKGGHIPYVMMIVALNENPREIVGYLATPKAGAAR